MLPALRAGAQPLLVSTPGALFTTGCYFRFSVRITGTWDMAVSNSVLSQRNAISGTLNHLILQYTDIG